MKIRVRARGQELELSAPHELTVGRDETCTVRLSAPVVSRVHAVLRPAEDGGWQLADRGSSGGTWRGEERIDASASTARSRCGSAIP